MAQPESSGCFSDELMLQCILENGRGHLQSVLLSTDGFGNPARQQL